MWRSEEAQLHSCGTYAWEWDEDPQAYRWDFHRCQGCAQREAGNDELASLRRSSTAPGASLDYSGWSIWLYPKGV